MREILFRGKRTDNGEWIEGALLYTVSWTGAVTDARIVEDYLDDDIPQLFQHEVEPSTIGQYIGLRDKTGKAIYEGDIVTYPDGDGGYEYCDETISSGVVTWGDESALFYITNNYSAEFPDIWDRVDEMEIIGNIHDTPKGE